MTDKEIQLLYRCAAAISDARRLWPAKHPARGLIVGIEEDCNRTYKFLGQVAEDISAAISDARKDFETQVLPPKN